MIIISDRNETGRRIHSAITIYWKPFLADPGSGLMNNSSEISAAPIGCIGSCWIIHTELVMLV